MRHRVVFLDAEKLDFDGTPDFSVPGRDVGLCRVQSAKDTLRCGGCRPGHS